MNRSKPLQRCTLHSAACGPGALITLQCGCPPFTRGLWCPDRCWRVSKLLPLSLPAAAGRHPVGQVDRRRLQQAGPEQRRLHQRRRDRARDARRLAGRVRPPAGHQQGMPQTPAPPAHPPKSLPSGWCFQQYDEVKSMNMLAAASLYVCCAQLSGCKVRSLTPFVRVLQCSPFCAHAIDQAMSASRLLRAGKAHNAGG